MTQKAIKTLATTHAAQDVTNADTVSYNQLRQREGYFETIDTSRGTYGINGALLRGHNTGTLYAITARSTALFIFI